MNRPSSLRSRSRSGFALAPTDAEAASASTPVATHAADAAQQAHAVAIADALLVPGSPDGELAAADDEVTLDSSADTGGDGDAAAVETRCAPVAIDAHGERLDKWLVRLAPEFSRSHLQHLIADGLVRLNGQVSTAQARRLAAGTEVSVELRPTASTAAFRPEAMALTVVYEDDVMLVIDKPVGLVVHPAPGNWSGTLLNGLLARDPRAATLPRAGIVHRLDKDTSGLMVVARTLEAHTALVRAIAAREVRREYLALVHGTLAPGLFSVERPIGRDPQSRIRMAVVASGKPARTDVELLASRDCISAVKCKLHTGRTHQIRVHLASLGFPLVADAVYGGRPALGMTRQALHAARLGLAHPQDGRAMSFEAALPADLAQAWQQVGATPHLP
jgi:23S rRNA pseudouridine1911/1915/1917 synthase